MKPLPGVRADIVIGIESGFDRAGMSRAPDPEGTDPDLDPRLGRFDGGVERRDKAVDVASAPVFDL